LASGLPSDVKEIDQLKKYKYFVENPGAHMELLFPLLM
jgi:hypothetical protein